MSTVLRRLSLVTVLAACGNSGSPGGTPGPGLVTVATGLSFPVDLTAPPGDSSRLFVVEKTGTIRIIRNGNVVSAPFLDIRSQVSGGSEQGLLGMAFDPDYATNGRFVVNFTDRAGTTRIVAYQVSADPDAADPASADTILSVAQPYSNHNGGGLQFGPDGYLYIGLGDGGSAGDPADNGQNRTVLLGKMLRLDLNGGSPYAIPADNPFADSTGLRGEIWSYGLRNPWRFSFDRQTGDFYIADVGQDAREEVNFAAAGSGSGANYGWSIMEGTACFGGGQCNQSGLTLPVLEYGHGEGCSVTGGYVYRGSAAPGLVGRYFYADYCQGWVRSFTMSGGQATDRRDWPELTPGGAITSFGQDAAGEIYILVSGGTVYRITDTT